MGIKTDGCLYRLPWRDFLFGCIIEMKKIDPNFVDSCHIDKDGRIRALMWTSGKSRMQYKHFGDAITFYTTYRTNRYDMPFGLFVGVNNYFQSIILGGVLMTNETIEAFEWVFSEFVKLMGGKAPATILTGTSIVIYPYS
jgi:hypothetical protein